MRLFLFSKDGNHCAPASPAPTTEAVVVVAAVPLVGLCGVGAAITTTAKDEDKTRSRSISIRLAKRDVVAANEEDGDAPAPFVGQRLSSLMPVHSNPLAATSGCQQAKPDGHTAAAAAHADDYLLEDYLRVQLRGKNGMRYEQSFGTVLRHCRGLFHNLLGGTDHEQTAVDSKTLPLECVIIFTLNSNSNNSSDDVVLAAKASLYHVQLALVGRLSDPDCQSTNAAALEGDSKSAENVEEAPPSPPLEYYLTHITYPSDHSTHAAAAAATATTTKKIYDVAVALLSSTQANNNKKLPSTQAALSIMIAEADEEAENEASSPPHICTSSEVTRMMDQSVLDTTFAGGILTYLRRLEQFRRRTEVECAVSGMGTTPQPPVYSAVVVSELDDADRRRVQTIVNALGIAALQSLVAVTALPEAATTASEGNAPATAGPTTAAAAAAATAVEHDQHRAREEGETRALVERTLLISQLRGGTAAVLNNSPPAAAASATTQLDENAQWTAAYLARVRQLAAVDTALGAAATTTTTTTTTTAANGSANPKNGTVDSSTHVGAGSVALGGLLDDDLIEMPSAGCYLCGSSGHSHHDCPHNTAR